MTMTAGLKQGPLPVKNAGRILKSVQSSDTSTNFLSVSRNMGPHHLPLVLVEGL